jgi:hypothetical protein
MYFEHWKKTISVLGYSSEQNNFECKIDGGVKVFHDKQKLKEYMSTKPLLQKILKGILHTEDENKHNHTRMGSIKSHEENRQALRR